MFCRVGLLAFMLLYVSTIESKEVKCKSKSCLGIEIYYESLCRDSQNFINKQLLPSYEGLREHLDISFIPYGKASHEMDADKKWKFVCQHGNNECEGNKAQSCGIDAIRQFESIESQQDLTVKLIGCVMSDETPHTAVQKCADKVGLSAQTKEKITQCEQSHAGYELLAVHGDKTHSLNPKLSFVPTIIFNEVFSSDHQSAALSNFKNLVCGLLPTESKANICFA